MESQERTNDAQRVALPAYLLQRLQAFRIGQVDQQSYVVRDKLHGKHYDFEPFQFFVLEVLPGCETADKLASVFQDRFGYPMPEEDILSLFASVADAGLFNEQAAIHPLLSRFTTRRYEEEHGKPRLKSFRDLVVVEDTKDASAPAGKAAHASALVRGAESVEQNEVLPPGVQDAIDLDPRASKKIFLGFDPRRLLKLALPLLRSLRFLMYLLPLPLLGSLAISFRHAEVMVADLSALGSGVGLLQHLAFSMATVNLCVVLTTALLAAQFRATVSRLGITFIFLIVPRFAARITHVKQLSRRERMLLHAVPLLIRVGLFSLGVLLWHFFRGHASLLADGALLLAVTAAAGFVFSVNPLAKSSGYQLLCAYSNQANLRGKSFRALLRRIRGESFQELDELVFSAYALATILFTFSLILGVVLVLGVALHRFYLGGSAWIVMGVVGVLLTKRAVRYFDGVQKAYERAEQFERWRKRALPPPPGQEEMHRKASLSGYLWRAVPLCFFVVLFFPYSYSPGGSFSVTPALQQVIATDMSGLVERVHAQGGEVFPKGKVIAELAVSDTRAALEVVQAQMLEQEATIADLKSRPRAEDVALAERALQIARTRAEFAVLQLERAEKLLGQEVIPAEEVDEARSEYQVRLGQVDEKQAELSVARLGASSEQIAAAVAKLSSLAAERDALADKLSRSKLVMPFDGKLLTLNLKQRGGSYYERGAPFAAAEMSGILTAEIEVPESEMEYVSIGAEVTFRPRAQSFDPIFGVVKTIDWNVTERPLGNVVKVVAELKDESNLLRNGMGGYAKVSGPTMPVWQAFTLAFSRFFAVEVWSWIP